MLATHTEFEFAFGFATSPGCDGHELTDTVLINGVERVALEQPGCQIRRHQSAFNIVTTKTKRHLGQVVGAKTKEVGMGSQLFRLQDVLDTGARVTYGSDYPATGPEVLSLSPLWNIETGMTRQPIGDPDGRILGGVEQRTSIEDMLRGYTLDAAHQLHMEHLVGSIEVGKRADLVVLGANIFEISVYDIHRTTVEATMVDGQLTSGRLP